MLNELAKELFDLFKGEVSSGLLRFHSAGFKTENYQIYYSRVKNDPFFDLLGYDYNIRFYDINSKRFLFFKWNHQIGQLTLKPNSKIKNKNITIEMITEVLEAIKTQLEDTN